MLKARNKSTLEDIIIVSNRFDDRSLLDDLRRQCRDDEIICPVCSQPVAVKAGAIKIRHFAHKHLANCPSHTESIELLQARATLFNWLSLQFPERVRIEHLLEGAALPRPIDCFVESANGEFAYWIVDRRMKEDDRKRVGMIAAQAGVKLVVVFTASVMKRNNYPANVLNLSTTERYFQRRTRFDILYSPNLSGHTSTIAYLDGETRVAIVFRAMVLKEYPGCYTGTEVTYPIHACTIDANTGDFVLPGESEKIVAAEAEQQRQEQMRKAREFRRPSYPPTPMRQSSRSPIDHLFSPKKPEPDLSAYQNREGTCVECGQVTRDWWSFEGKTGLCKCNDCRRAREARERDKQ